jgi:hypothetical protein
MIATTSTNGRLGNQIIRNLAVSLIAKKHDIKVDYSSHDLITKLGIDLFSGTNIYNYTNELNDNNYFSILNCDNLNYGLNPNASYFQTKEITNFLYEYLNSDLVKSSIIGKNMFNERYNNNNDLFVHVRLTDAAQWNVGIDYYLNTIESIKFDNLYISSDDLNHGIIKKILELYPNANLINNDEIKTIQFGSTCKHVLLSHGSFSAVIGYLSFFSNVHYPEYNHPGRIDYAMNIWYGDMFSIDKWIKCRIK